SARKKSSTRWAVAPASARAAWPICTIAKAPTAATALASSTARRLETDIPAISHSSARTASELRYTVDHNGFLQLYVNAVRRPCCANPPGAAPGDDRARRGASAGRHHGARDRRPSRRRLRHVFPALRRQGSAAGTRDPQADPVVPGSRAAPDGAEGPPRRGPQPGGVRHGAPGALSLADRRRLGRDRARRDAA